MKRKRRKSGTGVSEEEGRWTGEDVAWNGVVMNMERRGMEKEKNGKGAG